MKLRRFITVTILPFGPFVSPTNMAPVPATDGIGTLRNKSADRGVSPSARGFCASCFTILRNGVRLRLGIERR